MTPERWQQIDRVLHDALARDVQSRPSFLAEACAGDEALRQEVESLLAQDAPGDGFLNEPALHAAVRALAGAAEAPVQTLPPGTRVGPYEIVALAGAGGMGEVYEARDTRLDRTVAIKVLPPDVSGDAERRARFEREAKTVAGLNHPHICILHDVGDHDGSMFLVMEHLHGETLAKRLEKGPLALDQALSVAAEVADALAAAHRQGVIHRDLKPANVMLTKAGTKLLDFGLAKLTGHGDRPAVQGVSATRHSASLTGEGVIVGTLQYMAPEQVEGKPADARSDLWALGAILYEMVTGRRPFDGTSAAGLVGAILERDPQPPSTLQPLSPSALDRLVRRCLAKDPDRRWDSAHDIADELRWLREGNRAAAPIASRAALRPMSRLVPLVVGGILLTMAGAGVGWLARPSVRSVALVRPSVPVNDADEMNGGGMVPNYVFTPGGSRTALAWTPDGRALVFVGRRNGVQRLYVRRLDAATARPIPGTDGAQVPAVSPDGRFVAFWADRKIKKAPLGEGPVMDLVSDFEVPPWGLVWDDRGRLFFGRYGGPIGTIGPDGRIDTVTTVREGDVSHALPWPVPGGRTVLYTVRKREFSWGDEEVFAQTLATGQRKLLLKDATDARYVPTGHLVFLRRGQLFAVAFDPERLEIGTPAPLLDGVAQSLAAGDAVDATGAGQFAVSAGGTVAWVPTPVVPSYPEAALVTVDRTGQVTPLKAPVRSYFPGVRLSPDGRRLAVTIATMSELGLWVHDLGREGSLSPLMLGGETSSPRWSPDGQRLLFLWVNGGRRSIGARYTESTRPTEVILAGDFSPSSFTTGRHFLAVREISGIVLVTEENGKAAVQSLIEADKRENSPELSPDGRWLAYESRASGRWEVYVRPYPGEGRTEQVSLDGGRSPAWNPNGRELFFAGGRKMRAVDFTPSSPRRIGPPRVLFEDIPGLRLITSPVRCYDVSRDGQRFYAVQTRPSSPLPIVTHINLIENWFEELKAKVPPAR